MNTPRCEIDLSIVKENFEKFSENINADIYYAVKANPEPKVIETLVRLNSFFDCASYNEIDACISAGANPRKLCFGNISKSIKDIQLAYSSGVKLYALDSMMEAKKLAKHAPGSDVFCRLLTRSSGASWPLTDKFGCSSDMAMDILVACKDMGLNPVGISFHVGSQQTDPEQWKYDLEQAAEIFEYCHQVGVDLSLLNIGGGFPISYGDSVPGLDVFGETLEKFISELFSVRPRVICEPGRAIVGSAGKIYTEVILFDKKVSDGPYWLYLDVGRYRGLAETEQEAIKYQFVFPRRGETVEACIAGPTCDSADILYRFNRVMVPKDLEAGDEVVILNTGAYTTSYSSVSFNGFTPLEVNIT